MKLRANSHRRVVVTGLGALSAAGPDKESLWESLLAGRSGIGPITRFDASSLASQIAGEVRGFDPLGTIDARLKPRRMSRQTQLGITAAMQALTDAGIDPETLDNRRVAVVIGVATSALEMVAESALRVEKNGPLTANPHVVAGTLPQALPTAITRLFNSSHQITAYAISAGCAGGVDSLGEAIWLLRRGQADMVICGGADAPISLSPMAEFCVAGLSSTRNQDAHRASRPFDRERDSGVLAEGAGIIVLETMESASARGARCYLELLGCESSMDIDENRPCLGLESAMQGAMMNSGCPIDQIDYISAWGCGHPVLDRFETIAIKHVFGSRAANIAVSSIKAVVGNPFAAAGPLQLVALALSYQNNLLPPTANYEHPDLYCDLDYVIGRPRRIKLRYSLLNAHGIGGGNTALVVSGPPT